MSRFAEDGFLRDEIDSCCRKSLKFDYIASSLEELLDYRQKIRDEVILEPGLSIGEEVVLVEKGAEYMVKIRAIRVYKCEGKLVFKFLYSRPRGGIGEFAMQDVGDTIFCVGRTESEKTKSKTKINIMC